MAEDNEDKRVEEHKKRLTDELIKYARNSSQVDVGWNAARLNKRLSLYDKRDRGEAARNPDINRYEKSSRRVASKNLEQNIERQNSAADTGEAEGRRRHDSPSSDSEAPSDKCGAKKKKPKCPKKKKPKCPKKKKPKCPKKKKPSCPKKKKPSCPRHRRRSKSRRRRRKSCKRRRKRC